MFCRNLSSLVNCCWQRNLHSDKGLRWVEWVARVPPEKCQAPATAMRTKKGNKGRNGSPHPSAVLTQASGPPNKITTRGKPRKIDKDRNKIDKDR